jgi:hypothetical protein
LLFPLYHNMFLKPGNDGSVAGFAIVSLVFFYYFAFIVLLGAEVNSWAAGQRQTASDIASIVHEVQAHNTSRGAAEPGRGIAYRRFAASRGRGGDEDGSDGHRAWRTDHHKDVRPPKYEEAEPPDPSTAGQAGVDGMPTQARGESGPGKRRAERVSAASDPQPTRNPSAS